MTGWEALWQNPSVQAMAGALALLGILFFTARKFPAWRSLFIALTMVYNLVYLLWRVLFTLPLRGGWVGIVFGVLLLLAEWMGFFQSAVFRALFLKRKAVQSPPLSVWETLPTVDVLIATYNESAAILKKTVLSCQNMDYPADRITIWLCDDGNRPEIHALADTLGVSYLAREDHRHAKAGNINNALGKTQGELVMLLDADMMPKSTFLTRTVGFFHQERIGFVQTPQVFYNPDPFQFNLRLHQRIPNEQDLFMLDIQEARSGYNAVLHVGTNAIFRRRALEEIGGIPVGTITEDMATGMLIQAKGYQSVFLRDALCTGLSVENFHDLIVQRERWCRGNIQVFKQWNPLTLKGLTLSQRIIYLDGFVYWFFGVQKVIYLLCPLIYLIFGTVILQTTVFSLLLFWLPSYLASLLSYRVLTRKSRSLTWSHIYEVAMSPYIALAALVEAIFARPIPFRVTPKGVNLERTTFAWRTSLPYLALGALTGLGWAMAWRTLASGTGNPDSLMLNLAWSLYNFGAIVASILVCIERPRKRVAERVVADEAIVLNLDTATCCQLVDVSETGVKIECHQIPRDVPLGQEITLESGDLGSVAGKVVWKGKSPEGTLLGIAFSQYDVPIHRKLLKLIGDHNRGYHDNR